MGMRDFFGPMGRSRYRAVLWVVLLPFFLSLQAAAAPHDNSSEELQRKLDLTIRTEVTIERPVEEVWPYFLDMDAWMEDVRFQNKGGTRGEEGEVRLGSGKKPGDTYGAFLVKALHVTPCVQYVLKVTPEHGSAYLGFADFSFTETNGKTHLIYDFFLELTVKGMTEQEFQKFSADQYAGSRKSMARNNLNLKTLAEANRRPRGNS